VFFSSTHVHAPDKCKAIQFSLTLLCSDYKSVVNKKTHFSRCCGTMWNYS